MKYLSGDTFSVIKNGFKGTILDVRDQFYIVKWEHFDEPVSYPVSDQYNWTSDLHNCVHQLSNYSGFRESYVFCLKCNKKAF